MQYGNYIPNNYQQGIGNYGNQYFAQPMQTMQGQMQQMQQPMQMQQPQYKSSELQGRIVDSIDTVKGIEIPLNGSTSFFPLADNSMIITKQLTMDGTSKITIYKPVTDAEENTEKTNYLTIEEFNSKIKEITNVDYKDDIKTIKRQIEDITEDIKEINKDIKKRKD